jgi:hypothetical protein
MFTEILPQHFSVRLCLLCGPAAFQIISALICLLTVINNYFTEQKPVYEDVQVLHLKETDSGIIGDDLIVAGPCRIVPLRLIVRA